MSHPTTTGEMIEELQKYPCDTPIVWYHLENSNLAGQEIESMICCTESEEAESDWLEITLKEIGSDEGGN